MSQPVSSNLQDNFYLYFPSEDNICVQLDEKTLLRYIFDGKTKLKETEIQTINEFKDNAQKEISKKNADYLSIFNNLKDTHILRFWYLGNGKLDECMKSLNLYLKFQLQNQKAPLEMSNPVEQCLNYGGFYSYGRDQNLRPIVIFKWAKSIDCIKKHKLENYKAAYIII